jgi:hypothetical protein
MTQLTSSSGTILAARSKSCTKNAESSTLHARRLSQGMKKTVSPALMSKEGFLRELFKNTNTTNV